MRARNLLATLAVVSMAAVPVAAQADTLTVGVGGSPAAGIDLQGFYPGHARVHVGDTVHFDWGGFHTVAILPTGAAPRGPVAPGPGTMPVTNDAAGTPFWWGGIGEVDLNTLVFGPPSGSSFDGTTYTNSGAPNTPNPADYSWDVTFTAPGTYRLFCELHPHMSGLVTVVPATTHVPSFVRQVARGARQLALDAARAAALDRRLSRPGDDRRHQRSIQHRRRTVIAGDGTSRFSLLKFYPAAITIKAGQSVTWSWLGANEIHTVTFAPPTYLDMLDETLLGVPLGIGAFPSEAPGSPVAVSSTNHGNGYTGSGIVADNPGGAANTFTATFPEAGTFSYVCLVHSGMGGTVTVK